VRAYETLDRVERPLVVLETLSGQTLDHLLEEGGPLSSVEAVHFGLQLGSVIRYLHRRRILHLDLKPSNLIAEAGKVKLIDLSIARRPGRIPADTGTWGYMAPEQARGGGVGLAADVWGLGAVLFEALTGDPLLDDDQLEEFPQLARPIPRVEERRHEGGELGPLIDECLRLDPGERPGIEEVLARLEAVASRSDGERHFSRS
jgi:serine/threonine protein kinase